MSQMTPIEVTPSQDSGMTTPEPGLRRQVMSYTKDLMLVRHKMEKRLGRRQTSAPPRAEWSTSSAATSPSNTPGGRFEFKTGDSFIVPGNTEHQAFALEDSEVLDIFTPYREDYAPVS